MMEYGGWEITKEIGEGGQSKVYQVRNPKRVAERDASVQRLKILSGQGLSDKTALEFAKASFDLARADFPSELGALKIFAIPEENGAPLPPPPPLPGSERFEAIERLKNEISVLRQNRPGLPKLLDSNEGVRWIVTELFSEGTLEDQILRYRGQAVSALRTFRSLVSTVASLHKENWVHRDIKPANIFVRKDDDLVLGDFGIVYLPHIGDRLTSTKERVGPRDYMPQWADLGVRHENVHPSFDVYMLGKVLWCMVTGRLKLPREYHRRQSFNVEDIFPKDRFMPLINQILDRCLVEDQEKCLPSGHELLEIIDGNLAMIDGGVPLPNGNGELSLPCSVCGRGFYKDELSRGDVRLQAFDSLNRGSNYIVLRLFVCNVCTHRAFFAPNFPDEASKKGWTPWSPSGA